MRAGWRAVLRWCLALAVMAGSCAAVVGGVHWWQRRARRVALLAAWRAGDYTGHIQVYDPRDEVVYPSDFAPPIFRWSDTAGSDSWLVAVVHDEDEPRPVATVTARLQTWEPAPEVWERIKRDRCGVPSRLVVLGSRSGTPSELVAVGSVRFSTASALGAPLLFRTRPRDRRFARLQPGTSRWLVGEVAAESPPRSVLADLPVHAWSHAADRDGRRLVFSYGVGDRAARSVVADCAPTTRLSPERVVDWSMAAPASTSVNRQERIDGYLPRLSPTGRQLVASVGVRVELGPPGRPGDPQALVPIAGVLATHDLESGTTRLLAGAADDGSTHVDATWSPDGKWLYFCRAPAVTTPPGADGWPQGLGSRELPYRFDIWRVPFRGGRGGEAEPVPGASEPQVSEFAPRVSPDGRWLIFCRAAQLLGLRPDASLWIRPTDGSAPPRRLRAAVGAGNASPAWAPSSRWLAFVGRRNRDESTSLYLTHIDAAGRSGPALALERFATGEGAATDPVFLAPTTAPRQLLPDCLAAADLVAQAELLRRRGASPARIVELLQRAVAEAPSADNLHSLARALEEAGRDEEAPAVYRRALTVDPDAVPVRQDLGRCLLRLGRAEEARAVLAGLVERRPDDAEARIDLALALFALERLEGARGHLTPYAEHAEFGGLVHFHLGRIAVAEEDDVAAARHFAAALRHPPRDPAIALYIAEELGLHERHRPAAIALAERLCGRHPEHYRARLVLAALAERAGDLERAVDALTAASRIAPTALGHRRKLVELRARLELMEENRR